MVGFLDDRWPDVQRVDSWNVLGRIAELRTLRQQSDAAVFALGNNRIRERVFPAAVEAGFELPSVIHPAAWVSPSAQLGRGCIVMAGAIVSAHSLLGDGVVVNAGAVIDHDAILEPFSRVGIGACVEGGAVLLRGETAMSGTVVRHGS
jgi:UDP-3-O-[3-hydroxymyristoyl] glucosamine N-acyltransferase